MKFIGQSFIVLFAGLSFLNIISCNSEDPEPVIPGELIVLGTLEEPQTGLIVTLLSDQPAFVGYNNLKIKLADGAGNVVSDASIELLPIMNMADMQHSAPVEYPVDRTDENGFILGNVVFVMPSDEMGSWTLETKIAWESKGLHGSVTFDVDVVSPEEEKLVSFVADDDSKIFVSLILPNEPKVGVNDFEILVNKKVTMMDWPPDESFSIAIEPEMPTMDHGSPNNEDPVHVGMGHYLGKVNFTMTGYWKVNMVFNHGDIEVGKASFDITF